MSDEHRTSGRLPKYNPVRRLTFRKEDWAYLCSKLAEFFEDHGVDAIASWIKSVRDLELPRKADQDCLDACLCLLAAIEMADGKEFLVIGEQESGYIVTSASISLETELKSRCSQTDRDPALWINRFVLRN